MRRKDLHDSRPEINRANQSALTQISGGKYSSFLRNLDRFSTSLIATDQRFSQPEMRDLRRLLKYLRPHWPIFTLAIMAILLIVFTFAKGIAEYFSTYLMARIGQSAVLKLRQELYGHLLAQSATFFERHRSNYLVSRLVSSAAAIETAVTATIRD